MDQKGIKLESRCWKREAQVIARDRVREPRRSVTLRDSIEMVCMTRRGCASDIVIAIRDKTKSKFGRLDHRAGEGGCCFSPQKHLLHAFFNRFPNEIRILLVSMSRTRSK